MQHVNPVNIEPVDYCQLLSSALVSWLVDSTGVVRKMEGTFLEIKGSVLALNCKLCYNFPESKTVKDSLVVAVWSCPFLDVAAKFGVVRLSRAQEML